MRTTSEITVVVVNDDRSVLEMLRDVLEAEGYRVVVSEDADRGYRLIREVSPDLAILDVRMAGTPDWHVVDRITADRATASVPVLVCSGSVLELRDAGARLRALDCELVTMPFDLDDLLERVRRLTA